MSCLRSFLAGCWKRPSRRQYEQMRREEDSVVLGRAGGEDDALFWSRDLDKHYYGEFSFAVVQANQVLEDYSQVDTGKEVTFAGVYDGHGGPDAAYYVSTHLLKHLVRLAREQGTLSDDVISNAFARTEEGFLNMVRSAFEIQPLLSANGSCCLVGIIWKGTLYIANLGDSRAVLGVISNSGRISADQLSREHNAGFAEVREELKTLHPDDPNIVLMRNGAWRIRGIIQVSRSIGDGYLKSKDLALGPSFPKFHLTEPITEPVLRSDPSVYIKNLNPNDKFLILASDGLWEHLSNQRAVEIVHSNPRQGIAARLIKSALMEAARKANVSYDVIKKTPSREGKRRSFHDDITVIVIFIDYLLLEEGASFPVLSVKGSKGKEQPDVNIKQGLEVNPSSFGQSTETGQSSLGQSSKTRKRSIGKSPEIELTSLGKSPEVGQSSLGKSPEVGQSSLGKSPEVGQSSLGKSPEVGQSSLGKSPEVGQSSGQTSHGQSPEAGQSSLGQSLEAGQSSLGKSPEAGQSSGQTSHGQSPEAGQSSGQTSHDQSPEAGQTSHGQSPEAESDQSSEEGLLAE